MRGLFSFLLICAVTNLSLGDASQVDADSDPHSIQRRIPSNSTITFRISGVLQPGDSQYVHDLICEDTKESLGSVRMRWAHKYGHRYGGVGTVLEGDLEQVWKGDYGWITVRLPGNASCGAVLVTPRIIKIPD